MKALFISNDPSIFVPTSAARVRMHTYAAAIGELHIVSAAGRDAAETQEGSLFLHPVPAGKISRVFRLALAARRIIREHAIEVVSAQDPFEHGLAALRAVRGTKAKLHIQVHTDFLSPWFVKGSWRAALLNRYRRRIADRVLRKAGGIRAVSKRVKDSLVARFGIHIPEPSVIPVAPSATVPEKAAFPKHPFKFAFIAVGRLEPEKRIGDILSALKIVVEKYPMAGLFLVGDGRERHRLLKEARRLGLERQVVFLGECPDARALMGSAQAFVQASAYEGYGRTLIEAALAKVPVITTDVGIVGDVLKDRDDVSVVPIADPVALALAMGSYIEKTAMTLALRFHAEDTARAHLAAVGSVPARIAADLAHVSRV